MTQWMDPALKIAKNLFSKQYFYYFPFSVLALVLVWNFFSRGYVLTLDMIFSTDSFRVSNSFYGLSNQYSTLPFYAFLDILHNILSIEYIQKISFFLIFFVSGVSAYRLCPEEWGIGRYFTGFLYMLNPFIYVRFLAGHWLILIAFAVTPFVIKGFMDIFDSPSIKKSVYLAFLLTFVFFIETHTPFLLLIVFGVFYIVKVLESGKNDGRVLALSKSAALVGLFLLLLNSYWLVSSFIGSQSLAQLGGALR